MYKLRVKISRVPGNGLWWKDYIGCEGEVQSMTGFSFFVSMGNGVSGWVYKDCVKLVVG